MRGNSAIFTVLALELRRSTPHNRWSFHICHKGPYFPLYNTYLSRNAQVPFVLNAGEGNNALEIEKALSAGHDQDRLDARYPTVAFIEDA